MVCGFSADSRDEVIRVLADTLAKRGLVESQGEVTDGLTLMEELHTTVIGNGVAIPHATIEGVDRTLLMVAIADQPIEFGPTDQELCSVFFVVLSPPGYGGEHVRILARIARLASDPASGRTASSRRVRERCSGTQSKSWTDGAEPALYAPPRRCS